MNYNIMTHVNILSFQNTNQTIWNEVIYVYVKFIIPMFLEEETLEKYVPFRVETWFFTLSSVTFYVMCLTMRWTLHENYLFCLYKVCVHVCVSSSIKNSLKLFFFISIHHPKEKYITHMKRWFFDVMEILVGDPVWKKNEFQNRISFLLATFS